MKIKVTADHIRRGAPCFCWSCPIALAIADAIPGSEPWVSPLRIGVKRAGRVHFVEAPDETLAFMSAFDNAATEEIRRRIPPFEFELSLPWEPRPSLN